MNKRDDRAIQKAKDIPKKGAHDINTMSVSNVAMMTVFNIENRKMEEIKQQKEVFRKAELDRYYALNANLVK